jgi:rifampicin phosphotransferase
MRMLILIFLFSLPQSVRSTDRIGSRAEFDQLSRYTPAQQVMFAIDRNAQSRVYYINSARYRFHNEFLAANYVTLERGEKFYENNYRSASRRFILGSLSFHPDHNHFTFEFWEGDQINVALLRETSARLSATFFAPLLFKPNSTNQEEAARQAGDVARTRSSEEETPDSFLPLNRARGFGVLRIIERLEPDTVIERNEIVIFKDPPLKLTPLAGLITTTFGSPLAHVNLLARGWKIPNAYIKGAAQTFANLDGKYVVFEVREDGFTLRPALAAEISESSKAMVLLEDRLTPAADLNFEEMSELASQRESDAKRFGAKAANLGEVARAARMGKVQGITVPSGFSIPFVYYVRFIAANGLEEPIVEMLANHRFNHDPKYRRERLATLRARIESARLDPAFAHSVVARVRRMFGARGVFVRSSTNAEDLEHFSGAGLYTTVPNVRGDEQLLVAIRRVWASIWNYEAYEARERAGINHAAVYPSVLIQEGIPAEAAGVLITRNPFDKDDHESVYINAKRGLGIRVVEGHSVPEQLIFDPRSRAVRVLTRSDDDTMLQFNKRGGVRELQIETQTRVLGPGLAARLARAALEIKGIFGKDQDIEWVTVQERIFIVQSRPFVD